MNCPEHLVIGGRFGYVWMYWRDVPRETIPLRIWLNPLRYEVNFHLGARRFTVNRYGMAATRYRIRVLGIACKLVGHRPEGRLGICARCCKLPEPQA